MHRFDHAILYLLIATVLVAGGCGSKHPEDTAAAGVFEAAQSNLDLTNPNYIAMPDGNRCCVIIAHAGGGIDGNAYTNSAEAVQENYALGTRIFELDFDKTVDGHWVATHDWLYWKSATGFAGIIPPDLSTFSKLKLKFKEKDWSIGAEYSTISLQWVNEFLLTHKDATIVTDIKELNLFPDFVSTVLSMPSHRQFIFQAYSIKDIDFIKQQDPAARVILTLYRMGRPPGLYEEIARRRNEIEGITLPMNWANDPATLDPLSALGVPLYLHGSPANINSRALQAHFARRGVSGFYLD